MNLKELKEKILTEINQQKVYEKYIGKELKLSKAIKSPLRERDRNPSFNIYKKDGQILWKDFAEENGNIIDFTMRFFSIDFKTAIKKISDDFGLESFNLSLAKAKPRFSLATIDEPVLEIGVTEKNWNKEALAYWADYGIDMIDLKKNFIKNLQDFTYQNKSGSNRIGLASIQDPIFQILYPSGHMKIYRPKSINKAFKWRSNVRGTTDFWGIDRLTEKDKYVVIASGIKDALCIQKHIGIKATFPNSETSYPTLEQWNILSAHNRRVCILFDNDETGIKQSDKMKEKFNILDLRHALSSVFKDVGEYYLHKVTSGFDEDPLKERIKLIVQNDKIQKGTNAIAD